MGDILQETSEKLILNDEYKNFIIAAECILTKLRAKCRVSWELIAFMEKRVNMKKVSLLKNVTKKRNKCKCTET